MNRGKKTRRNGQEGYFLYLWSYYEKVLELLGALLWLLSEAPQIIFLGLLADGNILYGTEVYASLASPLQ